MFKNRKKTKLISLMLVMCLIFSSMFSITAFSADVDYDLSTAYVDEFSYEAGATYDQDVYDYIKQEMLKNTEYIYLTQFKISSADTKQVFLDVLFDNPELFHVSTSGYRYGNDSTGKYLSILAPNYIYSNTEFRARTTKFKRAADKLLEDIDPAWDDEMKALVVHDTLISNCMYSSDEDVENNIPSIYTAYGAIVEGNAVCQGYTLAYNYLLGRMGVESTAVISDAMVHSWSMVTIDGEHYHVDTTWDDPVPDRLGQVYHQYFLLSDEELLNDTSHFKHYDWTSKYTADSKKYDEYFWQSINTMIFYINECYYHIHNIAGHENFGHIVEYDNGSCKPIYNIVDRWYVHENKDYYWSNDFAYLAYDNGRFYFDTPDSIYSVNIYGEDVRLVYKLSDEQLALGEIYGLQIKDGKIYVSMTDSPNANTTNIYLTDVPKDEPVTAPTTEPPTTEPPTTEPVTEAPTTEPPTTEPPTTVQTEPETTVPPTEPETTVPAAKFTVAGDCMTPAWDPSSNEMTNGSYEFNGVAYDYALTTDVEEGTWNFKVTNGTWDVAYPAQNFSFTVTDFGTVTIYFNSTTHEIVVDGEYIDNSEFVVETITAVGNGDGTWLNGANWDPADATNDMTEVAPGVWEITYEDMEAYDSYEVKFAVNHSWTYNWTIDGIFDGQTNIGQVVEEDGSTVTLRIDINGFDFKTKEGTVVTAWEVTPPATEPETTVPTEPETTEPTIVPTDPATEPTEPTTVVIREKGDVDNDGFISIKDATTIQSVVVRYIILSEEDARFADVNGDGDVNISDATIVQMLCAKMVIV